MPFKKRDSDPSPAVNTAIHNTFTSKVHYLLVEIPCITVKKSLTFSHKSDTIIAVDEIYQLFIAEIRIYRVEN